MQVAIPAFWMRGGTSKGLYFAGADLPADPVRRDRVLLAAMGSPDPRQIDGIGGASALTSKVAIVSPSTDPGADVDYLFAQVAVDLATVDLAPSCGNILSGVAPFAIERGMVPAADGETRVFIHQVNTGGLVEAIVQTPRRTVQYDGAAAIDGVPGTAAPVVLNLLRCVGTKTGAMLPSTRAMDCVDGAAVTLMDVAVPMMLVGAHTLGKTGYESAAALEGDSALVARLERMRRIAGEMMGLGDVSNRIIPKVSLLAPPRRGTGLSSRYFVGGTIHDAHAVTGAVCIACAAATPGTVAHDVAELDTAAEHLAVDVEHLAGRLTVTLSIRRHSGTIELLSAGVVRTARLLFAGTVMVPDIAAGPLAT